MDAPKSAEMAALAQEVIASLAQAADAAPDTQSITTSLRISLSVPHKETTGENVGRRQLQSLPSFLVLVFVPSPTGDIMFAGRNNGQVLSWKIPGTRTGAYTEHQVLGSHKGTVTAMTLQQQFNLLLTGSSDYHIKVWDPFGAEVAGVGRCIQTIPAHDATVTAIVSHCDVVISASVDKTIKLWRFDTGRAKMCFPWLVVTQICVFDAWVTDIWASPHKYADGALGELCAVDSHGNVTILKSVSTADSDNYEQVRIDRLDPVKVCPSDKPQTITQVLVIPSLNQIVTIGFEDFARIRDVVTLSTLLRIPSPDAVRFVHVAWDSWLEELFLLDVQGKAHVWSTRKNAFITSFFVGYNANCCVHASAVDDRSSYWVAHREAVDCVLIDRTRAFIQQVGHSGRIVSLGFKRCDFERIVEDDDFFIASASVDNVICFWNRALKITKRRQERFSEISSLCVMECVPWCVTGHDNGSLKFWCLDKDKTFRFAAHENTISAVGEGHHRCVRGRFEPYPHLFTISYDGCLAVWDVPIEGSKAKCEGRVRVSRSELLCAVYDDLKFCYIVGGNDGTISMWSVDELKPMRLLGLPGLSTRVAHTAAVTTVALDGNYLYSGGEDGMIRMWNSLSGDFLRLLEFNGADDLGDIQHMIVLPDTGNLVVASRAGHMVLFDTSDETKPQRTLRLGREICCIAYHRKGDEFIAGLEDGTVARIHSSMLV